MARRSDTQEVTHPLSQESVAGLRFDEARAVFSLLVHHRNGVQVVALPEGRPVTIGRSAPADAVVPDASLSRLHARFTLEHGVLRVEDLASTNGTRVRGERVTSAELRPGESVVLGRVVVSPHMRSSLEPELVELAGYEAAHAFLTDALAAARHFEDPLAVLFLRSEARGDGAHVSRWWRPLRSSLRPVDRMAVYSGQAVVVLLPRLGDAEALDVASKLLRHAPRGVKLLCGVATFPGAAATADGLLEAARSAARRATAAEPLQQSSAVRAPAANERSESTLVAESPLMRALFDTVDRLAGSRLPILIQGETGSGKEVVAQEIHRRSPRAAGPLVCVNCGAIPAQLVESTLFGHRRGAFTGADRDTPGVFGSANGGTVLLDEVGELPASAQAALLRVLESGRMARVGDAEERDVDVRVLAATHRNLEGMCAAGTFRRDLLYRLDAARLQVPPLRERPEDIAPLAEHFLRAAVARGDGNVESIEPAALRALERHGWPGNVRELRNVIERAAVLADGSRIEPDDLPPAVAGSVASERPAEPRIESDDALLEAGSLKDQLRAFERKIIVAALLQTAGNQTEAARLLEVPVRTLSDKIRRLAIDVDELR